MKLDKYESVVIAWADKCYGPGWSNTPIWYIVRDGNGNLRQQCLQPQDQTREMRILFNSSVAVSQDLTGIVEEKLRKAK